MSFILNSIITIGPYKFRGVHDVKIVKTVYSFTDTCIIRVPTVLRLKQTGQATTEGVISDSNKIFTEGMKVTVELGYNGKYNKEFEGFVRRINIATPCEIECEGYVYQLRAPLTPKTFLNVDYKDIIRYIIAGRGIVLSSSMDKQTAVVNRFIIKTDTGAEALERLMKEMIVLKAIFHGNELYVGLENLLMDSTVKYKMGYNVIKDNDLKLRNASDVLLQINLVGVSTDGTKKISKVGDNTTNVKKKRTFISTDQATLDKITAEMLAKEKYSGYEGKITAFGLPFCEHSWKCDLSDPRYQERAGVYLIDSVETQYGLQGFRRKIGINVKLN